MMACKNGYELHHYFPKVAEESGFAFNIHRPRLRVDWHKIKIIDIENLIRERRFAIIEQHINDILNCTLESEFDVRILDEGVLKMFRLAQLAVEYQQFCRHYLDRSVYVLREEITALAKDLDVTKKELREKDEEIRKLRKKSKHTYRTPLPYGNDNIAAMILKTLANKGDIFPTSSNEETQYNKCSYCDKVFMNQLYLKGHISRRHASFSELPEKEQNNDKKIINDRENFNLKNEIAELKVKLTEMEHRLKSHSQENATEVYSAVKTEADTAKSNISVKHTKDAGVSTSNDDYLLDKIDEWKKEEHEKYNKELHLLRNQIIETMKAFKEKDQQRPEQSDSSIIEQLNITIKQQGAEIVALKNELTVSRMKSAEEEIQRKKEAEDQISFWSKRTEAQSKQYEALLQKLNDMTQELQESRGIANKERDRAIRLEELLQENRANHKDNADRDNLNNHVVVVKKSFKKSPSVINEYRSATKIHQRNHSKERKPFLSLHRKAQELLSIAVSSSDVSNASAENINVIEEKIKKHKLLNNNIPNEPKNDNKSTKMQIRGKLDGECELQLLNNEEVNDNNKYLMKDNVQKKIKKSKSSQCVVGVEKSGLLSQGSPLKIVRAKITEVVNNRLIAAGVDPLKSGLTKHVFQRRRMHLQQEFDAKSKKNPKYSKVKHSILTYLDSNSSIVKEASDKEKATENSYYVSPSKPKQIFNLTSVISNVKNKAKSLVKTNDMKLKRNALNAEVAKKAMTLLKTPPDCITTSPVRNITNINGKDLKYFTPNKAINDNVLLKRVTAKRNASSETSTNESDDLSESKHMKIISDSIKTNSISVDNLIRSPARRPFSASANMNGPVQTLSGVNNVLLPRAQSETNVANFKTETRPAKSISELCKDSHSDDESTTMQSKKSSSEENLPKIAKQTKGVLKNASSNSSLNKKKVLFDMDAIQMKSVSASPSQSGTDKSDSKERFELGLIDLNNDEWDISSIENDLKHDTKIQLTSRTSTKIAELKHTIESQLARRNETPTALVGGVDVLAGRPTMLKAASIAGSNTSLGSSILDDSDAAPVVNNKAFRKLKQTVQKDESDLDLSEYSLDGIHNKKDNESF